jgi:ADP-ribosylglycohydrolase
MSNNAKAMVWGSFVADSLSLGVHWIYNTHVIDKKWGRVENYIKPVRPTYHPTKDLGEFTHYGDQTLLLLKSVSENSGFDLTRFADSWRYYFKEYDGYVDVATKDTLANFAAGKDPHQAGAESDDLAGAARIAPLAYFYRDNLDKLRTSAREQTALTHNNPQVIDAAVFFADVVTKVLHGALPKKAIKQTTAEDFDREPYSNWVATGLQSVKKDTRQAILDFGQMCEIEAAFPSVVHLIARYEGNLKEGLVENAMAGGDSAGRGLIVGMILGAQAGIEAIPQNWLSELKAYQQISDLLEAIDINRPS